MSIDYRVVDLTTKLAILSRELDQQLESIGELREAIRALVRRQERLEDQYSGLKAAHNFSVTGGIDGLGNVTVTLPPEWGGEVPLVEVESEPTG